MGALKCLVGFRCVSKGFAYGFTIIVRVKHLTSNVY